MRRTLPLALVFLASSLLPSCGGGGGGGGAPSTAGTAASFIHTNTAAANHAGVRTEIDHPAINGFPDARLIVTPTFDPNSVYNASPVAVGYDTVSRHWSIYNDDAGLSIPIGCSYVVSNVPTAFVHFVTAANHVGSETVLDHPSLNAVPGAVVFATHNFTPSGGVSSGDLANPSPIGVRYDAASGRWRIHQEIAAIVNGISSGDAFNVLVLDEASSPTTIGRTLVTPLTHTAGSAISRHVALGGIPRIHAFHVATPLGGGPAVFNPGVVGIFDDVPNMDMAIFNENGAPLSNGQEFFLWLIP